MELKGYGVGRRGGGKQKWERGCIVNPVDLGWMEVGRGEEGMGGGEAEEWLLMFAVLTWFGS